MTPPHRENSHTKGSLGFRSDFAFGVRKKERFTGPIQDLPEPVDIYGWIDTLCEYCQTETPA